MRNLSTINEGEDILTVEALTLSSNTTNAVLLTIGNTTQSISQETLRTSLGLGDWAYRSSPLAENDIPSLSISKITNLQSTLDAKALKTRNIIAGTGLTGGGTLEADCTLSLATSGVAAGTYKSVTVDTYGRVTAGTNPTTLSGYGITDAATKTELAATDTELGVTNNAVAAIDQRVSDIEQWAVNPTFNAAYIKDCAVDSINLGGVDVWNEGEVVKIGGGLNVSGATTFSGTVSLSNTLSAAGMVLLNNETDVTTQSGHDVAALTVAGGVRVAKSLRVGDYLAINTNPDTNYRLKVSGPSYLYGKVNLGGTTYYLGNGAAGSKLFSLTVGSETALSISSAGVVSIANTTVLDNSGNAALKVSGGAYVGGNLAVMGKKIYFDTSHYIELDGNGYLHTNVGFYSDSFVASGGIGNAGGGGSSVNVRSYSEIPSIQSEVMTDVPSAYALKQVYDSVSGLSSSLGNIISGATPLNNPTVNVGNSLRFRSYDGSSYTNNNGLSWDTWTASSTSYSGILSSQDIRLASGKALFLTQGNGSTVKRAVYPDSSGNINIGSSGDSILIKGASYYTPQSTLSESSSNVPTSNAVVNYLNDQMRATNNAVAAVRRSLDDVLAWKVKPTAREMTVGTLGITDGINLGGVDVWNVGSAFHVGGNIYLAGSNGALYGTYNSTTYKKLISTNNYGYAIVGGESQVQVGSTSYATTISGSSISVNGATSISGTLSVGNYPVLGKKTYDLTSFFALAQGATFTTIDSTPVGTFISDIQNGHTELCVKGSVTLNGVAYTPRYDVQVGATTGQDISLYYVKLGSTPPLTFELLQFSYSGGAWKITNRISKSIS